MIIPHNRVQWLLKIKYIPPLKKIRKNQEKVPVFGTGFTQVPGGLDYNNRSVLSWHYYCELFDSRVGNETTQMETLIQVFCDAFFGPNVFNTVKGNFFLEAKSIFLALKYVVGLDWGKAVILAE